MSKKQLNNLVVQKVSNSRLNSCFKYFNVRMKYDFRISIKKKTSRLRLHYLTDVTQ